jgi:UDP-N-acetylglucosamine 2-epimerase
MKIVSVVGARPNFVKLAPVHKSLSKYCDHIIIHTGQHYDYEMSDIFFKELHIPEPDINLGVGSATPGEQTSEMIKRLEIEFGCNQRRCGEEGVGVASKPSLVLVYGDTNSTFAGAFAASINNIPVAHIEAGLRSFDRRMAEELNRILTDHSSDKLFAPTDTAVRNLKNEHVEGRIINSGDISVEVVEEAWKFSKNSTILKELRLESKSFILFTMHRAESTDSYENLKTMIETFEELKERKIETGSSPPAGNQKVSSSGDDIPHVINNDTRHCLQVVFPVHPRTEKLLKSYGLYEELIGCENVTITKPLGYVDFLRLIHESYKVVTDSGGLQKEAYLCSVPCITIRRSTEWVETLDQGWNNLCAFDKDEIVDLVLSQDPEPKVNNSRLIFGRGNTSEIIRDAIIYRYNQK